MKSQNSQQKLIVILSPTSSGKTCLAQKLCHQFNGFIISADSRQVYRYMDIGTGKVDNLDELKELRNQRQELLKRPSLDASSYAIKLNDIYHYVIDLIEPNDDYNVALYQKDFNFLIDELRIAGCELKNSVVPFLVGGTGLYIDAVVDNWRFPEGEPNKLKIKNLEFKIKAGGLESIWRELIKLDPCCAKFVQKNNPRRVVRALEYVLRTGRQFSQDRKKGRRQFDVLKIGIAMDRENLYKKIDQRVESRLKLGMVEEVAELASKHKISWKRLRQFGLEYRVIADWLSGNVTWSACPTRPHSKSMQEMTQRLKWNIHAYARRQLTWFRKDKEIKWVSGSKEAECLVREFLV